MMMSAVADVGNKRNFKPGTRERILDIAEIKFSIHGYESCSLRMISEADGINLGLIHYYFKGKEGLFSEVFLRRSKTLVDRRKELLEMARSEHPNRPIPVEDIVRSFIAPTIEMLKQGPGPRAYIRLQGLLRYESSAFARKLRGEAFNQTNNIFIRELQRSCPHLEPASVVWRFSAMVGAFYGLISQSARVNELSGGIADSEDIDAAYSEVMPFVVGGFLAEIPRDAKGGRKQRKPVSRAKPKLRTAKGA